MWRTSTAAAVTHMPPRAIRCNRPSPSRFRCPLPSSLVEVAATGAALPREGSVANRVRPLAVLLAPKTPIGHLEGTRAPCAREHEQSDSRGDCERPHFRGRNWLWANWGGAARPKVFSRAQEASQRSCVPAACC